MPNPRLSWVFSIPGKSSIRSKHNRWNQYVFIFVLILAAVFLYLALRDLDWQQFVVTLKHAHYSYLPLVLLWGSLSYFIRAMRWRVLLVAEKSISPIDVFWANMAGYLGNNVLPARAGELIRAMYVNRHNKITVPFALATELVERFIDLIALIILGSVSLSVANIFSEQIQNALATTSIIGVVGLIFVILLPYIGGWAERIVLDLPLFPQSIKEKLSGLLRQFVRGIGALHNLKRIGIFLFFTTIIWLMDGIGVILLGYILNIHLSLFQAFVLIAGLGISSAIPSTPGYVGVYQYVAIVVLAPFGVSSANALAFILFSQIMNLLVMSVFGGWSLFHVTRKVSDTII